LVESSQVLPSTMPEQHYPRQGNCNSPMVYSTLNKYGEPSHTRYGGQADLGGCRTGCGTWWPDFGPTIRDFSPGGKNHPTEHVFNNCVVPFTRAVSSPDLKTVRRDPLTFEAMPMKRVAETFEQFRHPQPSTEALWSSTDIMPYKNAGRRKCGETSNWRAALSSGAEGCKHGGRMPVFCKGPLLDNPDFHQLHPLRRTMDMPSIQKSCLKEQLAAGGATGTSPVDGLLRSSASPASLKLKDANHHLSEMTCNASRHISQSMSFKHASVRLNGLDEDFHTESSFRALPNSPTTRQGLPTNPPSTLALKDDNSQSMVSFQKHVELMAAAPEKALPNWVATRTVATRHADAAGGQAGPTAIRRTALPARARAGGLV